MIDVNHTLYHQILDVANDYLGPSAKRFVDRQIVNHLNKDPEQITRTDLDVFVSWTTAVLALLTDDEEVIGEFTDRLEALHKGLHE